MTFFQGLYTLQEMLHSVLRLLLAVACQFFYHEGPAFSAPDGWDATYGGFDYDRANSIHETRDGGYIVAGETRSFSVGRIDIWVLKLRPDGTVEWQKTYGGFDRESAESVQQARDGGYIVAGYTGSFGAGKGDVWILKLRADGTVEWQKTYGGANGDVAESVCETRDGGYIVAGWTRSFGAGKEDVWVLKLRADGTVEWQKTYGGVNVDEVRSIRQTNDSGYVVAGGTRSFGTKAFDVWVLKLRADGTVEWQKTYGGVNVDVSKSVQQTRDGGYIIAGYTMSFSIGEADIWVLKLRADGTIAWQKTYGGVEDDRANSVQQISDGRYIVAGNTGSFSAGSHDIWVLKLNSNGSIDPSCEFMRDTSTLGINSNATMLDTTASVADSNANPQDSSAIISATDITTHILCP
ncbi:MAG: hypothetical protein A3D89_04340 [Planctomycetes bacterium RIFCSPHIGHO2_02_FULL_52_58]|nr:MAG: hypothetical protein A3D89_04340 [Planctomycetes bacterium RIFCSPHIGHO2_02_FULL_52_58]